MRRLAGALALGALPVALLACDTPSVTIEVAPGGRATIGGAALPETVHVAARGRSTRIRVVNRDTVRHTLALFSANPGETVDYTVTYPGSYGGECSVHSRTGRLVYVVR